MMQAIVMDDIVMQSRHRSLSIRLCRRSFRIGGSVGRGSMAS